jgi:hypothetical protein
MKNAVLLNLLQGASAIKSVATWKKSKQAGIEVDFIVDIIDVTEYLLNARPRRQYKKGIIKILYIIWS